MRFGSVCSGIEAASVAWGPLGWQAAWFSEIEPFPSAVLAHHYPETPNLGDMTKLPEMIRRGEVEAPELFCGGTPCQAFSVAGLRRSLDDERGNLSLTFVEIADAIDDVRLARGELPAVVFWENVPGVLSTADNAFGCFLAGLAGDDQPAVAPRGKWKAAGVVVGPERLAAWRVLDAQFFGVAQRRRRVFVVSVSLRHPRAWAIAESILPVVEGVRRDTAPSREAGESAAPCVTAGAANGGAAHGARSGSAKDNLIVPQPYAVGNTLTARMHKGINTTLDEGQPPVLAVGTYNQTASDTAQTLCSRGDTPGGNAHLVPAVMQTVAFHENQRAEVTLNDTAGSLKVGGGKPGQGYPAVLAPTLTASNDPSRSPQSSEITAQVAAITAAAMQVRRLTPRECERLQGFPDDYTAIPWRGKPASDCPDGPRYKALGNSWAVPVVRWIGRRIADALA